jgi:hypothetical protein
LTAAGLTLPVLLSGLIKTEEREHPGKMLARALEDMTKLMKANTYKAAHNNGAHIVEVLEPHHQELRSRVNLRGSQAV